MPGGLSGDSYKAPLFRQFSPLSEARTASDSSDSLDERHSLLSKDAYYGSLRRGDSMVSMGSDQCTEREVTPAGDRPLTFWPLLALIFYTASGGPFGIEVGVVYGKPMWSKSTYLSVRMSARASHYPEDILVCFIGAGRRCRSTSCLGRLHRLPAYLVSAGRTDHR
jgi:hypothetical protein